MQSANGYIRIKVYFILDEYPIRAGKNLEYHTLYV